MVLRVPPRDKFLGKLIRSPLSILPKSTVVPILSGPLKGARWIIGSSVHSCWAGTYELSKLNLLCKFLRAGQVMYDVGANVGLYTLLGSRIVGSEGSIYAFEPLSENCRLLERHLELNHITNCRVINAAASNHAGIRKFDTTNGALMGRLSDSGETSVQTLDLDSFWMAEPGSRRPQFLKIDVEGAEMDVLRGASSLLSACAPGLLLATHGPEVHAKCNGYLASLGYKVTQIEPNELLALKERITPE
jgi:FkbM family methyltransferase